MPERRSPTPHDATAKDALVAPQSDEGETPRNSFIHRLPPVGAAGFDMAKTTRIAHPCPMRIAEDVRKYAAEQGIADEEALKKGMEEKSREFTEKGSELYAKA
jgi:phosphomethylpyrimidine synthase